MNTILEGVIIGGVGGAIAGIMVPLASLVGRKLVDAWDRRSLYKWMKESTRDEDGHRFRTTRAIASWNNMTLDRARYLCSIDDRIFLSVGQGNEEVWSIHDHGERSVYESRGIRTL